MPPVKGKLAVAGQAQLNGWPTLIIKRGACNIHPTQVVRLPITHTMSHSCPGGQINPPPHRRRKRDAH
jgi:hypothetical protein